MHRAPGKHLWFGLTSMGFEENANEQLGVEAMNVFTDGMARHWASIERAMKIANRNPAFRPQVELLLKNHFDLIDSMALELERRHVTSTKKCPGCSLVERGHQSQRRA
jgi:hypothetical protein